MTIHISAELSHVCPLDEITKHAAALESCGFHRVWIPDTLVSPWEVWLAASIIMHETSRIQIGLGVTNPYTRHPVVVAAMAATMQRYSGGRLSIAMGKGIGRFLEKAGIEQHATGVEECIGLLRDLIAGERTSFSGDAFQIDGIRLRTQPPETAVPIYFAAGGPPSWEIAVRVADGITTFWDKFAAGNRKQWVTDKTFPTAALVPFSLSPEEFFGKQIGSLEDLKEQIEAMEAAGYDEAIVAYRDMADLESAATLIR
ncbi:MAG: LLM class flavin-dependent oxidoreductase [Desulfobacterales bacterium]